MGKIYFITNNLDVGGSQKVLISLANEGLKYGYNVNIISLTNNLFLKNILLQKDNLNIFTCTSKMTSKGILNRIIITFNLLLFIFKNKPKFLHSHLWQIDIFYLILIKRIFNIKIIHTIHSPGSSYLKANKIDILNNYIEKKLITSKKNTIVTVVSNEIKDVISTVLDFKGECQVIPNGVLMPNINLIKKNHEVKDKYIFIFPARFQESKGHKILLHAFKELINISPKYNSDLILVGTELSENLTSLISELELTNHVKIIEPVSDIYKILETADFGVFPSLYEGHSIALCEMMAIGLPIVATNIISNLYITQNGKGALLCESNSVSSLFNGMKKLIDNPINSTNLSVNAKKIVKENFSDSKMFFEYNKMYLRFQ